MIRSDDRGRDGRVHACPDDANPRRSPSRSRGPARRKLGRLLMLAAGLVLPAAGVQAAWPERTIRFVLPSPPGSSPDVLMRLLTGQMSKQLGVPIVVDNRPGASYMIGTAEIARAAPDGYTIGYGNVLSLAINPALYAKLPYDPDRDLTLIGHALSTSNLLVVNPVLPVSTVPGLIDYLKRNPGKVTMASGGNGTTGHLAGELFKSMTGTSMLHVPYRGSPQAINDVIGGEAQVLFDNPPSIVPHVQSGRLRALGVTAPKRLAAFPEVAAIAESVPGYEMVAWGGLIGPAGLPAEIVDRLATEMLRALAEPSVVDALTRQEVVTDPRGPAEFRALVASERPKWADVIRRSGARVD